MIGAAVNLDLVERPDAAQVHLHPAIVDGGRPKNPIGVFSAYRFAIHQIVSLVAGNGPAVRAPTARTRHCFALCHIDAAAHHLQLGQRQVVVGPRVLPDVDVAGADRGALVHHHDGVVALATVHRVAAGADVNGVVATAGQHEVIARVGGDHVGFVGALDAVGPQGATDVFKVLQVIDQPTGQQPSIDDTQLDGLR